MPLTLTKYSGTLANQLVSARRSLLIQGAGAGGETGVQRIGILLGNSGTAYTCYWDPSTDTIFYDDGLPVISQE